MFIKTQTGDPMHEWRSIFAVASGNLFSADTGCLGVKPTRLKPKSYMIHWDTR